MEQLDKRIVSAAFLVFTLLVFGSLVFMALEKWSFIDSLFFSTVTLFIGYGDMAPEKTITKLFIIFYVLTGLTVGFYALTILATSYMEKHQPIVEEKIVKTLRNLATPEPKKKDKWVVLKLKKNDANKDKEADSNLNQYS